MRYTNEFKNKAIRLKKQGIHPNKIFKDANIDTSNKQRFYATKLINKWTDKPKENKKDRQAKKIEYLEAEVAYLKAENSFLVSLPKKKK